MGNPEVAQLQSMGQQAYAHLLQGRADLARPLVEQLQKLRPDDPQVRQLACFVMVIGFECSARRSPYTPAPRPAPATADLDLVAFQVDLPQAPSGIHGQIDYTTVLSRSFESAQLRAPGARRILLTDEATRVPDTMAVDEVIRQPIDRDRLMFERMRVQVRYLEARAAGRSSVLMDSDVVVNADPAAVFGEEFDVGLTWRPGFPDSPFNGGMIFVAAGSGGLAFFRKAHACYVAIAEEAARLSLFARDLRAWWGDQFALAALVGYREFAGRTTEGLEVDGTKVRFFPCESHNFTLEPAQKYRTDELRRKFFIHFKGNRKALQDQYLAGMRAGKF
jgi:hypothetical protein